MSKKRKKVHPVQPSKPKGNVVWRQSAEEATLAAKPHYNGFACGHGAHGSAKYSRARAKQAWQRRMRQEGASRGSFPFPALALVAAAAPSTAAEKMGRVCGGSGTRSRLGL
ncbi:MULTISPECIES: hypothetical protein [Eggerthellaceae]|uniref:hypothetical protein n=1 Tax=Eggerthellaceae TaxID=1643826 RepID=UPI003A8F9568